MAKDDLDRTQRGILGDINPAPAAREHIGNDAGEDIPEKSMEGGSRDVTEGVTGGAGTDIGSRPE